MSAPAFTLKHYLILAEVIRQENVARPIGESPRAELCATEAVNSLVDRLVETFKADNPKFNVDLFLRAAAAR